MEPIATKTRGPYRVVLYTGLLVVEKNGKEICARRIEPDHPLRIEDVIVRNGYIAVLMHGGKVYIIPLKKKTRVFSTRDGSRRETLKYRDPPRSIWSPGVS